jgi:DNA-binding transcriptional regulator YdaS (Cro superfamily)
MLCKRLRPETWDLPADRALAVEHRILLYRGMLCKGLRPEIWDLSADQAPALSGGMPCKALRPEGLDPEDLSF